MPFKTCLCLAIVAGISVPSPSRAQIQFEDVSSQAGFSYYGESWGASWGDLNGDRYPDLYASHHRNLPSLYLNRGNGTFSDVALGEELSGIWTDPEAALADLHGGAWADFDNDGDLDLYLSAGASDVNQFLVNEGGRLVNRTMEFDPGLPQWRARQPVWFDFTGDGKLDFFMASENTAPVFEQTDSGFVDRSAAAGFSCNLSQIGLLANLTGAGALEIICATAVFPSNAYEYSGLPFSKVTAALPRVASILDAALADFDGDLATDVFLVRGAKRLSGALQVGASQVETQLISSFGAQKGLTFRSDGDITVNLAADWRLSQNDIFIGAAGLHPAEPLTDRHSISFTLSAANPDVAGIAPHTSSRDRGAYIGYDPATGKWQLLNSPGGAWRYIYASVVSTAPVSEVSATSLASGDLPVAPALYLHKAAGFTDATSVSGLNEGMSCVSAAAGDFDNDMDVDLYLVCRAAVANIENRLYENQGDGTFVRVPSGAGAAGPTGFGFGKGENVVIADYDADGFLDLFVANGLQMVPIGPGGPDLLFRNLGGSENHWVELDLEGTVSNRDGVGARVYASTTGGVTQLREQNGGYHRWAQHSQRIHFGLGEHTAVDLRVEWPRGTVDVFPAVPVDKLYRVVEGGPIEPLVPGEIPPRVISVSINDVAAAEAGGSADFEVRLSAAHAVETVTVQYASADGTATSPDDYLEASGSLTFAPGETEKIVAVSILDDASPEPAETFTVSLSDAVNASPGRMTGIATIYDDEGAPCGLPVYDAASERGVFIGRHCTTGVWQVRVAAGGGGWDFFTGAVTAEQPYTNVTRVGLESNDSLNFTTNPAVIAYRLGVGGRGTDGFDFSLPAGTDACFDLDSPPGQLVYVGGSGMQVSAPFDLETLAACD